MIAPAQVTAVLDDLNLRPAGDNWFIGSVEQVPLALNVALTDEALTLLLQVRYPSKTFASENPPLPPDSTLAKLVSEEKAGVSLSPNTAWLTLFDPETATSAIQLRALIGEFFQTLESQGVKLKERLCVSCGAQPVNDVRFDDGRLQLVCDSCRAKAEDQFRGESSFKSGQLPFLIIPGIVCSVIGAIIWGGVWYGVHWLFQQFSSDRITVPVLFVAVVYGGAGGLVPQPLLYYISRVRNRGIHFGAWFAVICCACALILGELLFTVALFVETYGFLPSLALLPQMWWGVLRATSGMHMAGKLVGFGAALIIAYSQALPRKPVV